jgi:hypothetical protein
MCDDSINSYWSSDPIEIVDGHWILRHGAGIGPIENLYTLSVRRPAAVTWAAEGGDPAIGYQAFGVESVWRDRINQAVAGVVGSADNDCERVVDGLAPLLTLFENGRYQIRVGVEDHLKLFADSPPIHHRSFEFDVNPNRYITVPSELGGFAWEGGGQGYFFTEHRDRMNESTIDDWASRIADGERPVAVATSMSWADHENNFIDESPRFVVDGHHKLLAYQRLERQTPVIHIVRLVEHPSEVRLGPGKFAELRDMLRPEQHMLLPPYAPAE